MTGSNNFQVFAENTSNCMSDEDYSSSTARANGVTTGLADGTQANKSWHQSSIMTAAIAELAAERGVDVSDASLTTLKSALLSAQAYQTAGGTATAITLSLPTLVDRYSTTFIAAYNNSGASTAINTYPLYKPNTTTTPTLIAGKAYTAWYSASGSCFFVKASAEGTATAADVLAGKTFSNDTDTGLSGALALTGTATAANVLSGKTFYNTDPKSKLTGTLVLSSSTHGTQIWDTAGTYSWTVPAGVSRIIAEIFSAGGGGGGGGDSDSSSLTWACGGGGGGGGAGGCVIVFLSVTPGASLSIIVGKGGTGGAKNQNGTTGGTSSVGGMWFLGGGTGGNKGSYATLTGSVATAAGGDGGSAMTIEASTFTDLGSVTMGSNGSDGGSGSITNNQEEQMSIGGGGGKGGDVSGVLSVGGTLSFSLSGSGGGEGEDATGYCAGGGGGGGAAYGAGTSESATSGGSGAGGYVKIFY